MLAPNKLGGHEAQNILRDSGVLEAKVKFWSCYWRLHQLWLCPGVGGLNWGSTFPEYVWKRGDGGPGAQSEVQAGAREH